MSLQRLSFRSAVALCFGLVLFAVVLNALFKQVTKPTEFYEGPGNYLEEFRFQKQSKYFDFRFRQNPEKINGIARFADAFVDLVNRDFFQAEFNYPIRVLVLENQRTMNAFLRRRFNESPAMGIYLPEYKLFITHENAGLGTFSHEIMHPLMQHNLSHAPGWALEGVPAFFEKFYGYWSGEELVVLWGYQNPWRIDELGDGLGTLDLRSILSAQGARYDSESAQRMVAVFLWRQGKLKRFLELIRKDEKDGFDSYFEAAMEKPVDQILPSWQEYLDDVVRRRDDIMQLPLSTVFDTKPEFSQFVASHVP